MAPMTSTATHTAIAILAPTLNPESQDFDGDDFSNNLFSDLAPLLTLFGEQVTKQFLSMSMGWADNVLLAMGPLGILTTVVSAIRVGGVRKLKALIGRARESLATAEQELLSSTSDSVCEMWSGTDIVRQLGKPKTMDVILIEDFPILRTRIIGLAEASRDHYMRRETKDESNTWMNFLIIIPKSTNAFIAEEFASQAPNIALNTKETLSSKTELWFLAIMGILLQTTALAFPALASYLWKFPKDGSDIQGYAYPCFAVGTLAIILGVVLCSHIVESVTWETTFEPYMRATVLQVARLQRACTVSDQSFRSFLILNPPGNKKIQASRLLSQPHPRTSKLAGFASLLTVGGFICQFIGLRGLHWSATIFQLGVTLSMTGARCWVRRGLSADLPCVELNTKYELEETVLLFLTYPLVIPIESNTRPPFGWELMTDKRVSTLRIGDTSVRPCLKNNNVLKQLDDLFPDMLHAAEFIKTASNLARSMEGIINVYKEAIQNGLLRVNQQGRDQSYIEWGHHVAYHNGIEWAPDRVFCSWKKAPLKENEENQSHLESILRFWMCSLDARGVDNSSIFRKFAIGHEDLSEITSFERWLDNYIFSSRLKKISRSIDSLFGISPLAFSSRPVLDGWYVCVRTHYPLLTVCALELFSGFMHSIAASVEAIGGLTEFGEAGNSESLKEGTAFLKNSVMRSFSQVLVDCYMADDIGRANIFVVPPFVKLGLLPTERGNVKFDELAEDPSNHSSDQNNNIDSTDSVQGKAFDQTKQSDVAEPGQETMQGRDESDSQPEITDIEVQTAITELVHSDKEELSKDDTVVHTSQPGHSASEGDDDDGEGETKQV